MELFSTQQSNQDSSEVGVRAGDHEPAGGAFHEHGIDVIATGAGRQLDDGHPSPLRPLRDTVVHRSAAPADQ